MLADKDERARRLSKAIEDAGFPTRALAAEAKGVKESTLTSHANGTRPFDLEKGYEYARMFKVDPVWLLGLTDTRGKPVEALPNDEVLTIVLAAVLRYMPKTEISDSLARNVAQSLTELLRLVGTNPAILDKPQMIEGAAQLAMSRLPGQRPQA